ncbi:glycosyltransferase family 2 protein [Sulfurospirillum diekertiae]|uniref:Glycosyltransferase family 2 protein n=1 Tax=Sulfurospirillum diekertiae TaxID=1854492 RepID=A0A6G9VPU5_9BACT|nr:glycosyltransferase family 2 protein [Sulfurospirillum diekertiae]QIR75389.1 glycosyltransferase family 2 protein [Sulfurospirillum diekertiae]QIR78039.1 glycosyltransferase family 2 protein [Sulfurospirillum diekertiae]
MNHISAIVVLYNPNLTIIKNIQSYINNVIKLYVVDNSDVINRQLVNSFVQFKNLVYINNNGNQGIAHALNVGAKLAIKDGASWLLTMDQDSRFEGNNLENLIQCTLHCDITSIGIVSPVHVLEHSINKPVQIQKVSEIFDVMTSGNLLNLHIYQKIGEFINELFIDAVDQEYCLRLRHNHYKILLCEFALLEHCLGDLREIKLGFKSIRYSNHSPIRRYYITRNRLYLLQKYFWEFPLFGLKIIKWIIFEWIKIIVLEKDKIAKNKATLEGIRDFLRGKYGKYCSK